MDCKIVGEYTLECDGVRKQVRIVQQRHEGGGVAHVVEMEHGADALGVRRWYVAIGQDWEFWKGELMWRLIAERFERPEPDWAWVLNEVRHFVEIAEDNHLPTTLLRTHKLVDALEQWLGITHTEEVQPGDRWAGPDGNLGASDAP